MTRVEADLWSQLPVDVPALLALLPRADLYLQDEMQVAFHPTREQPLVSQGPGSTCMSRVQWHSSITPGSPPSPAARCQVCSAVPQR
jgi:hypothetical protein